MRIVVGADHRAYELKDAVAPGLREVVHEVLSVMAGGIPPGKYTCCMYKNSSELPNEFNRSSNRGVGLCNGI